MERPPEQPHRPHRPRPRPGAHDDEFDDDSDAADFEDDVADRRARDRLHRNRHGMGGNNDRGND